MGHRVGTFLLVIGFGILAWAATVYLWKDPFTTAYTAYEQRRLESTLNAAVRDVAAASDARAAHPSDPKPPAGGRSP